MADAPPAVVLLYIFKSCNSVISRSGFHSLGGATVNQKDLGTNPSGVPGKSVNIWITERRFTQRCWQRTSVVILDDSKSWSARSEEEKTLRLSRPSSNTSGRRVMDTHSADSWFTSRWEPHLSGGPWPLDPEVSIPEGLTPPRPVPIIPINAASNWLWFQRGKREMTLEVLRAEPSCSCSVLLKGQFSPHARGEPTYCANQTHRDVRHQTRALKT